MAAAPEQFIGFAVESTDKWNEFKKIKYYPKSFEENDVDIVNECCGVCGSDVHTITGGWGELPTSPLCVGHEIIGKVLRVGSNVTKIKPGMRAGVGAQVQSCMRCNNCRNNNENYCPHMVDKYGNQIYSQGGYASHSRAHQQFVFPIPGNICSEEAGPMMCAGLTTYSPLVRAGVGPGKKVAVVGIGGLGHFGVLWAKALGSEVWALSHSPDKEADALNLGADHFVVTTKQNWADELSMTFNFILNCADMTDKFNIKVYLGTLAVNGEFHNVDLPDKPLPNLMAQDFAPNGSKIAGSHIGSKVEALAMLQLASEKNLHPIIETIDISEEGCETAVRKVKENDVRYRVTLTGFTKAFNTM